MTGLTNVVPKEILVEKRRLQLVKNNKPKSKISELALLKKFERTAKKKILKLEKKNKGIGFEIKLGDEASIKFRVGWYPIPEKRDLFYTLSTFSKGKDFDRFQYEPRQKYVKPFLKLLKSPLKKIKITILKN